MAVIAPDPIFKGTNVKWPSNVPPEIVSTVYEEIVDTYELVVVLLLNVAQPTNQEDSFEYISLKLFLSLQELLIPFVVFYPHPRFFVGTTANVSLVVSIFVETTLDTFVRVKAA